MGSEAADEMNLSENKLTDKLTGLRIIATDFERRITGWKQVGDGGTWVYTGDALVGSSTASRLTGLLQSFCNEINLISDNDKYAVEWDKYNTIMAELNSTLLDPYNSEHYSTVCVMFSNHLKRIISIILTSRIMFKNYFSPEEKEEGKAIY